MIKKLGYQDKLNNRCKIFKINNKVNKKNKQSYSLIYKQ